MLRSYVTQIMALVMLLFIQQQLLVFRKTILLELDLTLTETLILLFFLGLLHQVILLFRRQLRLLGVTG